MPIYLYMCKGCGAELKAYKSIAQCDERPKCPGCRALMDKIPGAPSTSIITEKDPVRGKHFKRDVTEQLKKRAHEHFQKHEMDDLIQEHGVEAAKNFGWLDPNTGKKRNSIDEK